MKTATTTHEFGRAQPASLPGVEDQLAIMQLAAAYIAHADGAGRGAPADLFNEDGILALGTLRLETRAAIARFFEDRTESNASQRRVTRHVPGPIELVVLDQDRIGARSTAIVFAGNGDLPLACALPSTICDFEDVFARTPAGWRFASRTATVVFTGAGAATFAK